MSILDAGNKEWLYLQVAFLSATPAAIPGNTSSHGFRVS